MAKQSYRSRAGRVRANQACLCVLDGGSTLVPGHIVNVSSSGLLVSASEELGFSVGSRVLIMLTSEGGIDVSRIARCEDLYTGIIIRAAHAEGSRCIGVKLDRRRTNPLSRLFRRVTCLLLSS